MLETNSKLSSTFMRQVSDRTIRLKPARGKSPGSISHGNARESSNPQSSINLSKQWQPDRPSTGMRTYKAFPVLQIRRSKYLVGAHARRLWLDEEGQIIAEIKDKDRADEISLEEYLASNLADEVDALCKLVLIH